MFTQQQLEIQFDILYRRYNDPLRGAAAEQIYSIASIGCRYMRVSLDSSLEEQIYSIAVLLKEEVITLNLMTAAKMFTMLGLSIIMPKEKVSFTYIGESMHITPLSQVWLADRQ